MQLHDKLEAKRAAAHAEKVCLLDGTSAGCMFPYLIDISVTVVRTQEAW